MLFVWLRFYYLMAGRQIKRIEATARSPIYSHLGSSLNGLPIIRSHNAAQRFIYVMQQHFDYQYVSCSPFICDSFHEICSGKAFYMFMTSNRWLAVRLDVTLGHKSASPYDQHLI